MSITAAEWFAQRVVLQEDVVTAVLKLQEYMGVESFHIPLKNKTGTPLQISLGQITSTVEELENELAELSTKLYALKHERVVEIAIDDVEPHLVVTIGPDESSPEDEASDDNETQPTPIQPPDTNRIPQVPVQPNPPTPPPAIQEKG